MADPLNKAVLDPILPIETKRQIVNAFWECNLSTADIQKAPISCYFDYYLEQCQQAYARSGDVALLVTHADVIATVGTLKRPTQDRKRISQTVRKEFSTRLDDADPKDNDQMVRIAIDLCLSLWLMIRVGNFRHQISLDSTIIWHDRTALETFLEEQFLPWQSPTGPQSLFQKPLTLERVFNAKNLSRIAGMDIYWTDNLLDHLMLKECKGRNTVFIFHNATFLRLHQDCPIFPAGLVDETMRTIALLLPEPAKSTKKFFKNQQRDWKKRKALDPEVIKCGALKAPDRQIEKFNYWRERLEILKQVFDDEDPGTLSQWWFDRRKKVQWYTFWVAIAVLFLTVLFGFIQCLEGGFQVVKAYYP